MMESQGLPSLIHSTVSLLPNAAYSNANDEQKLDALLSKLISESSILGATARLDPCNSETLRFIHLSTELLGNVQVRPTTRSKILLTISNLCLFNISLRKSTANNARACQAIYKCLELAIEEQLGPQNKIDILRLLQMLTYERIEFAEQTRQKLLPFLTSEILSASPNEFLPYCMCILCNLVCQSRDFTESLKQMTIYKCLCARILQLLSHNSKAIVVSALVLIGYLDDKTRDTVYSSQNLSQTFLCIFNILASSSTDILMTTHIAVDLLRRLVICPPNTPSDPPTLSQTAKNLTSYSFFEKSIQKVTSILGMLDPRSEESRKITALLLSFCQIDELKTPVCMAITAIEPTETMLATPIHALLRIARLSFDEAIFPEVPLTALQLFTINIREALNGGKSVRRLVSPPKPLFVLLKETLEESRIPSNSALAPFHALKIAEGLRLAEALSNDEEIRFELLELVSAQQCSAIFDHQLDYNPVSYTILPQAAKPTFRPMLQHCEEEPSTSAGQAGANLPLWSIDAVSIPIQLMRLLASLKDYSKPHKELYWRSLKERRLLPFLAYAISRGDHELIFDAFVLLTHCAQVHEFPLRMLSNLTSKCAWLRNAKSNRERKGQAKSKTDSPNTSIEVPAAHFVNGHGNGREAHQQVEELAQTVASLREKLARKEARERELEAMLGQQQGTRENIQHFVEDLRKCVAESEAREAALEQAKADLLRRVDGLQRMVEGERARAEMLEREKKLLEEESGKEQALHAILRGKFDEMTQKFDTAAKAAFEKQVELEKLTRQHQSQAEQFDGMQRALEEKANELEEAKRLVVSQEGRLTGQMAELAELRAQNQQMAKLKQSMERLLGGQQAE